MYFLNALHLKQFYSSDLGQKATAYLRRNIHAMWEENDTDCKLALGYPIPLWPEDKAPTNTLIVMPAEQGAMCWPDGNNTNKTIVAHDAELPVPSNSINRVILLHALEFSANIGLLMKEVYRTLVPNGRVLLITPNRLGLWTRSSKSPFGYGRPFSIAEIKSLLEDTEFTFHQRHTALFLPPTHNQLLLRSSGFVEALGQFLLPMCGGVHIVEAEKQIYAGVMEPIRNTARKPIVAPVGAATPTGRVLSE